MSEAHLFNINNGSVKFDEKNKIYILTNFQRDNIQIHYSMKIYAYKLTNTAGKRYHSFVKDDEELSDAN